MNTIEKIIRERRSIKPSSMNGKIIDQSTILSLLELADWAPTHGRTEPWRFMVFSGEALQKFSKQHAELYKTHTPEEKFTSAKYQSIIQNAEKASHIVVVYMKRQLTEKIPLVEEIAATAIATQHILLGAQAMGIASLWSTGGMTHHSSMKNVLGLAENDLLMAMIYLGYTDEPAPAAKRNIPLAEKIVWMD